MVTVPPRSFHTNINYFRGTVKKNKNLRGEVRNVKQTKLINSTQKAKRPGGRPNMCKLGRIQDAAFQREAMLECFKRKLLKDMEAPGHGSSYRPKISWVLLEASLPFELPLAAPHP